ncbi:MAG: hypothetical protein JWM14_2406 [Chitinophagaceae bacterium]|nr:hypothetical protein [Chitinophagaceae bacterium]
MKTLLPFYFLLKNLFAGCHQEIKYSGFERDHEHRIERVANLDERVLECSGMAYANGLLWTLGDSGTEPVLYGLDSMGSCVKTITHPSLQNKDWEELAVDQKRHRFFIGDIGNNLNKRKDLKIFVVDSNRQVTVVPIAYALQEDFPPNEKLRNYDCEAMVYAHDSLILFSKNRGIPLVSWYSLSTDQEQKKLLPVRQLFMKGMVTAAAYHGASGQLVLLAYGKLYWFKVENQDVVHAKPWLIKKIPFYGQTEAICFDEEGNLHMSSEKGKHWKITEK